MEQTVSFMLGSNVTNVTGTINGEMVSFTETSPQIWEAEADKAEDGKYSLDIIANTDNGNQYNYKITLYYFDGWTPPIYDRTENDLIERTSKGYLNYHDLNRIESNCEYLSVLLRSYGYTIPINTKTNWNSKDFPWLEELERIKSNVEVLKDTFYVLDITPLPPDTMDHLTYRGVNDIEKILFDIYGLIDSMIKSFKYSGTFYSGGEGYAFSYN